MKKLLVLALVLSMATIANAGLKLTAGGADVDAISLFESDNVTIGVEGFEPGEVNPTPYLIVTGPGAIAGGVVLYDPGSALTGYYDEEAKLAEWEMTHEDAMAFIGESWGIVGASDFSYMEIISDKSESIPPTIGLLVDGITFHCEGIGDVVLHLIYVDDEGAVTSFDTLTITQVPEPMTLGLLGLGGLFLRRRK